MDARSPRPVRGIGPRVVVVGAGAFGGWTALELVRRGARVTLVDAWGPAHPRASSGAESRVIRSAYGTRGIYTRMAIRALARWRQADAVGQRGLFTQTGALWMFGRDDSFGRASAAVLADAGVPYVEWTIAEAARRYPQISFEGVTSVFFEPGAGYLLARRACEFVVQQVAAEGGEYRVGSVRSPATDGAPLTHVTLDDGAVLQADAFVLACGPWLGTVCPDVIGDRITPTRQEIFYFGAADSDSRFAAPAMPVWLDVGERLFYGTPAGGAMRGFKVADDTTGPRFDPTGGDRTPSADGLARARAFVARRFPGLADAPSLGAEVCQYEATPDAHFILDRHPAAPNVWIAGGGSGHGFKMGPVVGEIVASLVLGESAPDPTFGLARFSAFARADWPEKWS